MPARLKQRRKLQVGDRLFLFWHDDREMHVASEDKRFAVVIRHLYTPWDQRPEGFLPLKVCGPEFPALEDVRIRPLLVAYPEADLALTPGAIRRLIDWCFTPGLLAPGQAIRCISEDLFVVEFNFVDNQEERS